MARKPKTDNALQAAFDAEKIKTTVEDVALDARGITCTVSGIYDHIQRQGRSDEELIALAVASYAKVAARKGGMG